MKILQINKYFYQKGGAETVFFNTIDLLEKSGHTVIPFCLKSPKNRPSKYEHYFVDYPELSDSGTWEKIANTGNFVYNRKAARQLERLLMEEKPDIAHIHLMFNSFSVSILPVLKKHHIPVVMTVHDYRLICPAYTCMDSHGKVCAKCIKSKSYWQCAINKCSHGNLPNSILLALESYFRKYFYIPIDCIDRFIFVSKFSQDKHIEAEPAFENKSFQLYNFTLVRETTGIKDDYILCYGRLSDEKGIQTLLKAVKTMPCVRLKIIGTGPLENELKQCASPNVEFLGFKSGTELYEYVRQARFVIIPSECYENNPMTIIESMTLGTPVIGSCIGGIPELIDETSENRNGFLFEVKSVEDLEDKITKALSLPEEEYRRLSTNAQTYAANNFSPNVYIDKLMGIYNFVLNTGR